MASQTLMQTIIPKLSLEGSDDSENTPEWMKNLRTKGWTVVPDVLTQEQAAHYADNCYEWLEGWGLGYNRHDPSTRKSADLPWHSRGGLYNRYGIAHEQFVWDLKSESALVEKFAQIWGTDELVVSYDGLNLSIPEASRAPTDPIFKPWPHVDQSPYRTHLQCVQGILNLLPNGPQDGGLTVLEGSNALYTQLWQHFDHKKGEKGWNTLEYEMLDDDMTQWLEQQGCKWVKVCCNPGDLLLWDSRTVHYGSIPSSINDRFAAYVCYKPANFVPEKARNERIAAFKTKNGTAHDPAIVRLTQRLPPEDHPCYAEAVKRPLQEVLLSKRGRQLAGLEDY
ncbi:hypothetical protein BO94DRAFT_530660 [Aspergillus sclerotioniger CBS 115572]|uniref:Phytanoyl-CoA dioxygenase n=1 Tax=Aspergillus sclerotioniger CBS 115572 TaxID=1450535 RepID=A0A317XBM5_9EURO|nr:hypothetical protein BO94DRAFT_530660 [Aspergillus sclerotioniger CBS 115572]PWY95919.1 hypothetical protein BO94DRAFT_530660 [Aspergillus sclerotioniger CBS 115572]